jgi:hypothetical protein
LNKKTSILQICSGIKKNTSPCKKQIKKKRNGKTLIVFPKGRPPPTITNPSLHLPLPPPSLSQLFNFSPKSFDLHQPPPASTTLCLRWWQKPTFVKCASHHVLSVFFCLLRNNKTIYYKTKIRQFSVDQCTIFPPAKTSYSFSSFWWLATNISWKRERLLDVTWLVPGGDGLSTLPNNKIKLAYISTKTNLKNKIKEILTMLI